MSSFREQVAEIINTLMILPSDEAVKQGAMGWSEIVEYKTSQILSAIEAALPEKRVIDGGLNDATHFYNKAIDQVKENLGLEALGRGTE